MSNKAKQTAVSNRSLSRHAGVQGLARLSPSSSKKVQQLPLADSMDSMGRVTVVVYGRTKVVTSIERIEQIINAHYRGE